MNKTEVYSILCDLLNPAFENRSHLAKSCNLDAVDWAVLWEIADTTHCLPELYQSVLRFELASEIPDAMLLALTQIYDVLLQKSSLMREQIFEITAALNSEDIFPVWLKGATLLLKPNWKNTCRLTNDLDFWLPNSNEHVLALGILEKLGYKINPNTKDVTWKDSHHFAPRIHPQRVSPIEVHRHIVRPSISFLLQDEDAVNHVEWHTTDSVKLGYLSADDQIAHSFVQCTVMATPPISSGCIRMMKVIDLLRLMNNNGYKALPQSLLKKLHSNNELVDITAFMTYLERYFYITNDFQYNPSFIERLEQSGFSLQSYFAYLKSISLKPPSNWLVFLSDPKAWPAKFVSRYRMFRGQKPL